MNRLDVLLFTNLLDNFNKFRVFCRKYFYYILFLLLKKLIKLD